MGIVMCDPTPDDRHHEGYAIGLVRDDDGDIYSDSGTFRPVYDGDVIAGFRTTVCWIQVACDCGWRSRVLCAPPLTEWAPNCLFFPSSALGPAWEDVVADIWHHQHIDILTPSISLAGHRQDMRERTVTS
jgi:hypothetical protein